MDYSLICQQLHELSTGIAWPITILANASALLYQTLPDLNWCGFYLAQHRILYLGPFQGKTACTEIPFGKGVCGTSAVENRSVRVDNVHLFPGHIACDSSSRSELVIPIHQHGVVTGVLDLDSPLLNRFTEKDCVELEKFCSELERYIDAAQANIHFSVDF